MASVRIPNPTQRDRSTRNIDKEVSKQRTVLIMTTVSLPLINLSLLGRGPGDHNLFQSSCVLGAHPMRAVLLSAPHVRRVSGFTFEVDLHTCRFSRRAVWCDVKDMTDRGVGLRIGSFAAAARRAHLALAFSFACFMCLWGVVSVRSAQVDHLIS